MFWLTHPVLSINLFVYSLIPSLTNKSNLTSLFKHFPKKITPRTRPSVTKNKLSELVTPILIGQWSWNKLMPSPLHDILYLPNRFSQWLFSICWLNSHYMARIMLIWHKTLNNQSICWGQWIGISKMSGVHIQVATDLSLVKLVITALLQNALQQALVSQVLRADLHNRCQVSQQLGHAKIPHFFIHSFYSVLAMVTYPYAWKNCLKWLKTT